MSISLFPHNQAAYASLLNVLETENRACIVHPTGTGKSFIGFKYCEDHPEQAVLWLSPSEYIFKTQSEALLATGAQRPDNITFMTYAKLSQLEPEELDSLRPDAIILDEMHRAAAPTWEKPVQTLLAQKPEPVAVGLTATSIRYLDGQKDTTQTFEMSVASEMTLGEAIVRGILNPPKYVLSLFSYHNDLEKYRARVRQAKSKAVRDRGEETLEALRRALDKAEGMDAIFRKHMTDAHGKYLVFCSNAEHMRAMMEKAPAWFGQIDKRPHMYSAYSADPATSRAFADFKADDSEHLKLLFCIDMLNEGVHVDGVSGVILLRPTVSPIVYKQQIGRAMAAGAKKDAVIFDIVLNIENLYSIGAIEEEMQIATTYYRSLGLDSEIVNEHFKVVDEVRDCLALFDRLNDTLTASWELMYAEAKKYAAENGDLNVPRRYVTADGYSLGQWLETQRRVRAGTSGGRLSEEQIALLDALGMRWESMADQSWARFYEAAEGYFREHGDLLVGSQYMTAGGLKLGAWINNLRTYRKSGIKSAYLTAERIQALDAIGMQWDVLDYLFEKNYAAAVEYHRAFGDLNVPTQYVSPEGIRLGVWIANLRSHFRRGSLALSAEQRRRLDELGMLWNGKYQNDWDLAFEEAKGYWKKHGSLDVPTGWQTASGLMLGRWVSRQRNFLKAGRLSEERKRKLDTLGMVWEKDPWGEKYRLLEQYYREHGSLKMPGDYVVDGVWLNRWLSTQLSRLNGKGKALTSEQREKLMRLGVQAAAGAKDTGVTRMQPHSGEQPTQRAGL